MDVLDYKRKALFKKEGLVVFDLAVKVTSDCKN